MKPQSEINSLVIDKVKYEMDNYGSLAQKWRLYWEAYYDAEYEPRPLFDSPQILASVREELVFETIINPETEEEEEVLKERKVTTFGITCQPSSLDYPFAKEPIAFFLYQVFDKDDKELSRETEEFKANVKNNFMKKTQKMGRLEKQTFSLSMDTVLQKGELTYGYKEAKTGDFFTKTIEIIPQKEVFQNCLSLFNKLTWGGSAYKEDIISYQVERALVWVEDSEMITYPVKELFARLDQDPNYFSKYLSYQLPLEDLVDYYPLSSSRRSLVNFDSNLIYKDTRNQGIENFQNPPTAMFDGAGLFSFDLTGETYSHTREFLAGEEGTISFWLRPDLDETSFLNLEKKETKALLNTLIFSNTKGEKKTLKLFLRNTLESELEENESFHLVYSLLDQSNNEQVKIPYSREESLFMMITASPRENIYRIFLSSENDLEKVKEGTLKPSFILPMKSSEDSSCELIWGGNVDQIEAFESLGEARLYLSDITIWKRDLWNYKNLLLMGEAIGDGIPIKKDVHYNARGLFLLGSQGIYSVIARYLYNKREGVLPIFSFDRGERVSFSVSPSFVKEMKVRDLKVKDSFSLFFRVDDLVTMPAKLTFASLESPEEKAGAEVQREGWFFTTQTTDQEVAFSFDIQYLNSQGALSKSSLNFSSFGEIAKIKEVEYLRLFLNINNQTKVLNVDLLFISPSLEKEGQVQSKWEKKEISLTDLNLESVFNRTLLPQHTLLQNAQNLESDFSQGLMPTCDLSLSHIILFDREINENQTTVMVKFLEDLRNQRLQERDYVGYRDFNAIWQDNLFLGKDAIWENDFSISLDRVENKPVILPMIYSGWFQYHGGLYFSSSIIPEMDNKTLPIASYRDQDLGQDIKVREGWRLELKTNNQTKELEATLHVYYLTLWANNYDSNQITVALPELKHYQKTFKFKDLPTDSGDGVYYLRFSLFSEKKEEMDQFKWRVSLSVPGEEKQDFDQTEEDLVVDIPKISSLSVFKKTFFPDSKIVINQDPFSPDPDKAIIHNVPLRVEHFAMFGDNALEFKEAESLISVPESYRNYPRELISYPLKETFKKWWDRRDQFSIFEWMKGENLDLRQGKGKVLNYGLDNTEEDSEAPLAMMFSSHFPEGGYEGKKLYISCIQSKQPDLGDSRRRDGWYLALEYKSNHQLEATFFLQEGRDTPNDFFQYSKNISFDINPIIEEGLFYFRFSLERGSSARELKWALAVDTPNREGELVSQQANEIFMIKRDIDQTGFKNSLTADALISVNINVFENNPKSTIIESAPIHLDHILFFNESDFTKEKGSVALEGLEYFRINPEQRSLPKQWEDKFIALWDASYFILPLLDWHRGLYLSLTGDDADQSQIRKIQIDHREDFGDFKDYASIFLDISFEDEALNKTVYISSVDKNNMEGWSLGLTLKNGGGRTKYQLGISLSTKKEGNLESPITTSIDIPDREDNQKRFFGEFIIKFDDFTEDISFMMVAYDIKKGIQEQENLVIITSFSRNNTFISLIPEYTLALNKDLLTGKSSVENIPLIFNAVTFLGVREFADLKPYYYAYLLEALLHHSYEIHPTGTIFKEGSRIIENKRAYKELNLN